eukprot:SM000136S00182  [mRNA]  locus=s136:233578:235804:+ [translate_table: standard]
MPLERIVVVVTPDATTSHNALHFALRNVYCGHGSIVLLHVISSVPSKGCQEGGLGLHKPSRLWRAISLLQSYAACTGRSRSPEAAHIPVSFVSGSRLARYLHEEVHPQLQELKKVCNECKVSASIKVAMDDDPGQGTLEQATLLGATCLVFGKPSTCIGRNLGRTAAYCAKRKPAWMAMFVVDRTGLLFQHQTETQPKAPGLRVKLPDFSGSFNIDLMTSFSSSFSISRGSHSCTEGGRLATSHTPSSKNTSVVTSHSVTKESPLMALPAAAKPASVFPTPPRATNIIKPAFVDHHMFFGQLGRAQSTDTHAPPGQQKDLLLDALKCGSALKIPDKWDSFGKSMGTGSHRKSFTDVQERSRQEGPREELWSVDSGVGAAAEYQSEQEPKCLSVSRQGRGTVRPLEYY